MKYSIVLLAYPTTFTAGFCILAQIVSVVRIATRMFDVIGTILTRLLRSSDYVFARLSLGPKHHFGMPLANSYYSTPEKTEEKKAKTEILGTADTSEEKGTSSISYS